MKTPLEVRFSTFFNDGLGLVPVYANSMNDLEYDNESFMSSIASKARPMLVRWVCNEKTELN